MKIQYFDKELDNTKEHEILTMNEFGFLVEIKYTEKSWYPEKLQKFHNVTEVHYMYNNDGIMPGPRVAFESDIQGTGFTREIDHIEYIKIKFDTEKHKEFREE